MKRFLTLGPQQNIFEDVNEPSLMPDDVLVEVKAAGICGSDIAIQRGRFAGRLTLPRVLGHEWSGRIVQVGSEVNNLNIGDSIASEEIFWCGHCYQCRSGYFDHCTAPEELGFTVDGAFASHVKLPARYCHKLLPGISYEVGALIEPLSVAYNAVFLAGPGINCGQKVVIIGMGPIGLCISLWAKNSGAEVIGIENRPYRKDLARKIGIETVFSSDDVKNKDDLHDVLENIDILVEASGSHDSLSLFLSEIRPKGAVIMVGHSTKKINISLEPIVLGGLNLYGSCGQIGHNTYKKVIHALQQQLITPEKIITHRFPLKQANDAFELALNSDEYGKIMFIN